MKMLDKKKTACIRPLGFSPAKSRNLDIEVFMMSELRARVTLTRLSGSRRYDFHLMLLVTHGTVCQSVDSTSFSCGAGTVVFIRPGQVHHLEAADDWDGWLMLFRPEMVRPQQIASYGNLSSELAGLSYLLLTGDDFHMTEASLQQMYTDSQNISGHTCLNQLMYHQLASLIIRFRILSDQQDRSRPADSAELQRFTEFKALVEENFTVWHQVRHYSDAMNCSGRSVTRATTACAGCSAKAYISDRITLEARRLLTHTAAPVHLISQILGFDEPTHFIKFFIKNAGFSPARFRNSAARRGLSPEKAQNEVNR